MGSTGEADRKRRHLSSISSPASNTPMKHPFTPLSEGKKLDTVVLQFQNQQLVQKLEAQKVERASLENKFCEMKEKHKPYDETLAIVKSSWEELVDGLESCSVSMNRGRSAKLQSGIEDGARSPVDDAFLSRLLDTGATENSSANNFVNQDRVDTEMTIGGFNGILCNIVTAIDKLWHLKDKLHSTVLQALPEDGSCRQKISNDLRTEVRSLRATFGDLFLKHKLLSRELQNHQDSDAKNKAELKRLRVELDRTIGELEESNIQLATLKSERDAGKGAFLPVLNLGNKPVSNDRTKDKLKELQEMESLSTELLDQASDRLLELKRLHERRIVILKQLADLQNTVKNVKGISSSQAYLLVSSQLTQSKADLAQYQALFEKLQIEREKIAWQEKQGNMQNELLDISHQNSAVANSRISELRSEIQKQINERNMLESKLEEASRGPGRREIIAEFKSLVSSFPEDMGSMQSELSKYKEAASEVHSLRADVHSLSTVLERKAQELQVLSSRSADQVAEMQKLQAMVCDLKDSDTELNLILEMYQRESTDSRDVLEARNSDYKAWAHVQSLTSSLDERNLELRVKAAIEAEATSQQRLAAAEAEIADLRQKLEASKREKSRFADNLKSKHEENDAYLSEIESIGQAYDEMQTQNQHLLHQITERDDYNIKLVLEGVRAKQHGDALLMEKHTLEKSIHRANTSADFSKMKSARIDHQVKMCSDQLQRLSEDRSRNLVNFSSTEKRLSELRKSSQPLMDSLSKSQSKVEESRLAFAELEMELEKERFGKKRLEEEVEIIRRKASHLQTELEGSSVIQKLQQELKEYRDIVKCSICLERPKEVVITKCYHLFCNPCVQRIIKSRHRKCPVCAANFGANDIKPVYI